MDGIIKMKDLAQKKFLSDKHSNNCVVVAKMCCLRVIFMIITIKQLEKHLYTDLDKT